MCCFELALFLSSILITDQTAAVKKIENEKISARVESEEKNARELLKRHAAEKDEEVKRVKHEEVIRRLKMKNRKSNEIIINPVEVAVVLPKTKLPEVVFTCNSQLVNKREYELDGKEKTTSVQHATHGNVEVKPNKNGGLKKNGLQTSLAYCLVCRFCGREEEDFVTCGSCGGELEESPAETVAACEATRHCRGERSYTGLQGQEQNVKERGGLAQLARNVRNQLELQENREREDFNSQTEEVRLMWWNNRAFDQELKETKDRLKRQQEEYTIQRQDLSIQESQGLAEKREMDEAVSEALDKVKKMETLYREGVKKEEELTGMESSLSVKCQMLDGCQREMEEVTMRISLEQEQGRQLRKELEKEKKERKEEVCKLEIRILEDQFRRLDSDLSQRKRENERRVQHLYSLIGKGHNKVCNVLNISTRGSRDRLKLVQMMPVQIAIF